MLKKVRSLLKVPKIVLERVPFPAKSSQLSALKSVPKKFEKNVQNLVLKKVHQKVLALLKVHKIVPKRVHFPPKSSQ